jgi:acyl carrier protein
MGKIDRESLRRALEPIDTAADQSENVGSSALQGDRTSTPASDSLAGVIAAAWCDVLGSAPPSPTTSFFAVGGSSLTAMRMAATLQERTGRKVSVRDMFRSASVQQIVELLETRAVASGP